MNEWSLPSKLVRALCLPSSQSARIFWRDVSVSAQMSELPWNRCGGTHGCIQALWSYRCGTHSAWKRRCAEYLQWNQKCSILSRWRNLLQPTSGCFTYCCCVCFYAECLYMWQVTGGFPVALPAAIAACEYGDVPRVRVFGEWVSKWAPKETRIFLMHCLLCR